MKKVDGKLIFAPSDLIVFMESEFASWMNRYHVEYPGELTPDEADASLELLQQRGLKHEGEYLDQLKQENKDVCEIADTKEKQAITDTLNAMKQGRQIIYQGVLESEGFAGIADFLVKVPGASKLGDYHYEPWDTKLALKPKPYFIIQLCCYAEMLEAIQGVRPKMFSVVLGDKTVKTFRTDDYFYFYQQLKKSFLSQQDSFDRNNRPEPSLFKDNKRWTSHAEAILEEIDHLSRIAFVRQSQIRKLKLAGINTMQGLVDTDLPRVKDLDQGTLANLKQQARLQIASKEKSVPEYETIEPDPNNPYKGLALLPPASELDVCFDMEGYPHVEGGLEYLFGVTYKENGNLTFKDWWAHSSDEEKHAFEEFIDWVYDRWQKDPAMHIYHYASYEVTALRRLMGRHGTREREVDNLLRNGVFVDLYNVVRQSLRVGEPSYSIKYIEHLYMPARETDVATAMDSVVFFARWLESGEPADWQKSKILADIRKYNKDDCDSTWLLCQWLRGVQDKTGVQYLPRAEKEKQDSAKQNARNEASQLAEELLTTLPTDEEKAKLQQLLAYLLEFHWREAKPVYWKMFDRQAMTEDELYEENDCIAGITRTGRPPEAIKQSTLYEYSFDSSQDTKMQAGTKCLFAHDLTPAGTIHRMDAERGILALKLGRSVKQPPPDHADLIPQEIVSAAPIAASIFRTVSAWVKTGNLPQAIEDFLLMRRPRIVGNTEGPICAPEKDTVECAVDVVGNLNNTTLCIQGPPGAGKTYTASKMIAELLKQGKTVGVSSNSHKAIANLMRAAADEVKARGIASRMVKIQSEEEDFHLDGTGVESRERTVNVFAQGRTDFQLIGGTAWAFSDQAAVGALDYLFVDEAGQVSVANLVGMSPSTKNIVLVGDQMQLNQPIQGSHPGDSGMSTLEYLLRDHQTIPAELGIFLGTTQRLHPDVCKFISGSFYEDRLHPEAHTVNRVLLMPEQELAGQLTASSAQPRPAETRLITKSSGILFIPVDHEGNTQGSDEEAEVIARLVKELVQYGVTDKDGKGKRQLTLKDILIVAPYNMQVNKIKQLIPGAEVGSVDKFQGLGRPVVILSMCMSDANASPRGLEFIFSKNRINVAISRAETLAIVVGSPALAHTACTRVAQMNLVNSFCRILESDAQAAS